MLFLVVTLANKTYTSMTFKFNAVIVEQTGAKYTLGTFDACLTPLSILDTGQSHSTD